MIAPTIDCDVETGKPYFVITKTVMAEDRATINAPDKEDIDPNFPSV